MKHFRLVEPNADGQRLKERDLFEGVNVKPLSVNR